MIDLIVGIVLLIWYTSIVATFTVIFLPWVAVGSLILVLDRLL